MPHNQASLTSTEAKMPRQWQLQEAKARFSQLVERALAGEVQVVTRRGRPAVVVIPYEEYERMQAGTTSAWDIFKTAPHLDDEDLFVVGGDGHHAWPDPGYAQYQGRGGATCANAQPVGRGGRCVICRNAHPSWRVAGRGRGNIHGTSRAR